MFGDRLVVSDVLVWSNLILWCAEATVSWSSTETECKVPVHYQMQ
jgi:hypothetical protein